MISLSRQIEIKERLPALLEAYNGAGEKAFVERLDQLILQHKVKFPLLEFLAKSLYQQLPPEVHIPVCDAIINRHTLGGNVIAGMLLQLHLPSKLKPSIDKAVEYIIEGNTWYVCDIIGERVMGHALLTQPIQSLPLLQALARHENKWILRSVGTAGHYAIKNGLEKKYVSEFFALLLSLSTTTDFHTKKGVGWAVKTTAKFHPDIIQAYGPQLEKADIRPWFRTKLRIGLSRTSKYAHRHTR